MPRSGMVCAVVALGAGSFLVQLPAHGESFGADGLQSVVRHGAVVSAGPAPSTPHVLDGRVESVVVVGDTVVAGGEFTQVSSPDGSATYDRRNIFAFNKSTGEVSTSFAPSTDGAVESLVVSADGQSVYVGGRFDTIDGAGPRTLARLQVSDGTRTPGFAAPELNGRIKDMALVDGRLWIAGNHVFIDGQRQPALATLDAETGAFDPYMRVQIAAPREPGDTLQVLKFDVAPAQDRLALIGNFTSVGGQERYQLAMLNIQGGAASVAEWGTGFFTSRCNPNYESYMRAIDFSPDGEFFAVATSGGYASPPAACDVTSRFETHATGETIEPTWVNYAGGDSVTAVEVTDTAVYVGGHVRWQNNPWGANQPGRGSIARPGLAALDPANGNPYTWNPGRTLGVGVFDLLATNEGLWVASDTDVVAGKHRGRIAFFPLAGGTTVPPVQLARLPNQLYLAASGQTDALTKQSFDGITPGAAVPVDGAGIPWNDVRGTFFLNGQLYTGSADGTFQRRAYDGTVFGAANAIDTADQLVTDTAWHGEVSNITGMFFSNGRLYYTRTGSDRLWSRAFTPESDIVGPQRSTASTRLPDLDWRQVRGMILVDQVLYFGYTGSPASLRKVVFAGGKPSGTVEVIATGDRWTNRGMFLYTNTSTVQFVDAATVQGNHNSFTIDVPASVNADNRLLLFLTLNATDRTISAPTGAAAWSPVGEQQTSSAMTKVWQTTADDDTADATIQIDISAYTKGTLTIAAYRGTNGGPVAIHDWASKSEATRTAKHVTPRVHTTEETWPVSYWGEKSSGTTTWTPPAGSITRSTTIGQGGGRISTLLTDPGAMRPAGHTGGLTATTNDPSRQASMWTILLTARPA